MSGAGDKDGPLRLVLAFHCHQPVGNFGWVVERATAEAYRPLLEALARHPRLPFVLHVSGPLLEWWVDHAHDLLALVKEGAQRGQIELQASGLYEPILPAIPRRDRADQVKLHRAWLRELFGADAQSLWLTERVWEPGLPSDLHYAGIRSVLVDDTQFEGAGLRSDQLDGSYATEDQGKVVRLFPISRKLRYLLPFRPVGEIVAFLRERHAAGQRLLVFGDDGEKFGLWPKTKEWVWGQQGPSDAAKGGAGGWMEAFLTALEENASWLKTTTIREASEALPPAGQVYLPTASYFELGHWSLPPPAQQQFDQLLAKLKTAGLDAAAEPFLRGATWRNFLARYPEAARLEQRMIRTSELTHRMGLRPPEGLSQLSQLHPAVRSLFRGQCNCAYWHGVFGGLYLPFLRDAVVDDLLAARAALERLRGDQEGAPHAEVADLDADGVDEVLLEGGGWSLWIGQERGALVELLDHWPTRRNLVNVIGRRPEAYHAGLIADAKSKDESHGAAEPASIHELSIRLDGAEELLRYDPRPRGAFALELADADADAGALAELKGPDRFGLATRPYRRTRPIAADRARVDLAADVETAPGTADPARLEVGRSFEIVDGEAGGTLEAGVTLRMVSGRLAPCTAAVRLDLSVPGSGLDERRFLLADGRRVPAGEPVAFTGDALDFADERGSFRLSASRPFRAAIRPIRTVSRSEGGVDTCLQGSSLVLAFPVELVAAEPWRLLLRLQSLAPARKSGWRQ